MNTSHPCPMIIRTRAEPPLGPAAPSNTRGMRMMAMLMLMISVTTATVSSSLSPGAKRLTFAEHLPCPRRVLLTSSLPRPKSTGRGYHHPHLKTRRPRCGRGATLP